MAGEGKKNRHCLAATSHMSLLSIQSVALQLWDLISSISVCLCTGLFVGFFCFETGLHWGLMRLVWLSYKLQGSAVGWQGPLCLASHMGAGVRLRPLCLHSKSLLNEPSHLNCFIIMWLMAFIIQGNFGFSLIACFYLEIRNDLISRMTV